MNKYLRNWMLGSNIAWLRDMATRSVRQTHARRHAGHQKAMRALLFPEGGTPRVLNGPFEGLKYLDEAVWGSITPRWTGSYESCLWPAVRDIVNRGYSRIIDVGCAEGYYAAGLCRALPHAEVHAFDLDPDSRAQVQRLWELNGKPGRLTVGGLLDHAGLQKLAQPGTLLICDIEGGEMQLLNADACPALRTTDILVEVHETGKKSVADNAAALRTRFQSTHDISTLDDSLRVVVYDHVQALDEAQLKKAMSEGRPYAQVWLWMKARAL